MLFILMGTLGSKMQRIDSLPTGLSSTSRIWPGIVEQKLAHILRCCQIDICVCLAALSRGGMLLIPGE